MTVEVVAAAVVQHGRVLAARRTRPPASAGRWELPGGKVEPGESSEAALTREVHEELGCTVEVVQRLDGRVAVAPDLEMTAYVVRLVDGKPIPREHDVVRWLAADELDEVDWEVADRDFLAELRALLVDGERLVGGNVSGAARVGRTVRRSTGPWSPAVHALLRHLSSRGLPGVPEVLGTDRLGREVLTYLPGRVLDVNEEMSSPELLADAMRWLRRFHDTVEGFVHPGPWRSDQPGAPGQLVCHNDFAPYNVATNGEGRSEKVVGVFDWDMAGPGTRLEDLAFAAWNWVPLHQALSVDEAATRLELMAGSYAGDMTALDILGAVVPRIESALQRIRSGQEAGDPGMLNLALVGEPGNTQWAVEQLSRRVPDMRSRLVSAPRRTVSP
ncbi:MAG: phosphotransferase [Nocardioidaceae bacterium]